MSELRFDLFAATPLPVEVYDDQQHLVSRTLSSDSVTVNSGTYSIEAQLPDGSSLRRSVEVPTGADTTVELGQPLTFVAVEDERSADYEGVEDFGALEMRDDVRIPELRRHWIDSRPVVRLALYDGGHSDAWTLVDDLEVRVGRPISLERGIKAIGLFRPGLGQSLVQIPGGRPDLLGFTIEPDASLPDAFALRVSLAHPAANALLDYLDLGQISNARLMAESTDLLAERLLRGKNEDPIAAAAGAFTLLRMNAMERLHDWPANLAGRFRWLPDGIVVAAEQLARQDRHEDAAHLLRKLPNRGLPVLSVGLDLAVERLRTYTARWPEKRGLRSALVYLTRYALATDFTMPVTTFVRTGPGSPKLPRPDKRFEPKEE